MKYQQLLVSRYLFQRHGGETSIEDRYYAVARSNYDKTFSGKGKVRGYFSNRQDPLAQF